jgi:beta-galactosidase/beta-glucuronidase
MPDTSQIPRAEYPRPQFVRTDWLNLNGDWEFEIDSGDSGLERGLLTRALTGHILVPFCPESPLSGINNSDFMNAVWYRRTVTIPADWTDKRLLLHFQAVDYDTTVWANGREVGRHRGGFTTFTCDLGLATAGEIIELVVRARDPNKGPQPRGKQTRDYAGSGAHYGRITGIWQTVWIEPVPDRCALQRPRLTPDVANSLIRLEQPLLGNATGLTLRATLRDAAGVIYTGQCAADADFAPSLDLPIPESRCQLWSPSNPHLYDLDIELINAAGQVVDKASSYAGLRSVRIEGKAVKINGEAIFQRLVLDQGFYSDGILTAPSDEALKNDIELSIAAGFNGARLHQKVFEERFLYHADKRGYLVWGEFPDWGAGGHGPVEDHQHFGPTYVTQWLEAVERDYSHPAIIGWCPLNETWQPLTDRTGELDDVTRAMFLATKALDTTRPVLDTSGYSHRVPETDIYDSHDYEQSTTIFDARHKTTGDKPYMNMFWLDNRPMSVAYRGQPYFVSEFGGIWWNPNAKPGENSWGYGERPQTLEEFYTRFEGLCATLLGNVEMFGYCYTQLTDVYQEQNGIYTFARGEKFDMDRIRRAQQRPAAIETEA